MSRLDELQDGENEAKQAWRDAVKRSLEAKAYADLCAEKHTNAQQAVIAELQRLVGGEAADEGEICQKKK